MTTAHEHDFTWHQQHEEALTVECRVPYCEQPIGAECIDQAGKPLVIQPAHFARRRDAATAAGHPVLPDPPAEEPDPEPVIRRPRTPGKTKSVCEHCDGELLWARTRNDARMPVDRAPSDDGNVLITAAGGELHASVFGPRQAAGARAAGKRLHVHHKVTCPYAHRWANKH